MEQAHHFIVLQWAHHFIVIQWAREWVWRDKEGISEGSGSSVRCRLAEAKAPLKFYRPEILGRSTALHAALCCRPFVAGTLLQALCCRHCRPFVAGTLLQALCCTACSALLQALCRLFVDCSCFVALMCGVRVCLLCAWCACVHVVFHSCAHVVCLCVCVRVCVCSCACPCVCEWLNVHTSHIAAILSVLCVHAFSYAAAQASLLSLWPVRMGMNELRPQSHIIVFAHLSTWQTLTSNCSWWGDNAAGHATSSWTTWLLKRWVESSSGCISCGLRFKLFLILCNKSAVTLPHRGPLDSWRGELSWAQGVFPAVCVSKLFSIL